MIDSANLLKDKTKLDHGSCPTGSKDFLNATKKVPLIKTITNYEV